LTEDERESNNRLIATGRRVLGVEDMPPMESLEGQYKALGYLLAGLREELARIDQKADREGFCAALVAYQDRLAGAQVSTARALVPQREQAPEGVSQAFWYATDPRLP